MFELEDIRKRWEKCIASLFYDDREENDDDDDKAVLYKPGLSIQKKFNGHYKISKPGKRLVRIR